ncbi:MAG TPA: hypothetical protein VMU56_08055 [Beijerinckiaceae bacterium]|nr:hypothetical protein [Beijerinckiaceae bacterium]
MIGVLLRAAAGLIPGGAELRALWSLIASPLGMALVAAGLSFGAGWHERASHDRSAALAAQASAEQARITQLETDAVNTARIARRARAREVSASAVAQDLQKKVVAYEAELARPRLDKTAARPHHACLLSAADRRRLRRFADGAARPSRAAARRSRRVRKIRGRP